MNQIQMSMNQLQPAFSCDHLPPVAILASPRELSEEEIEMVSGGLPFVIAPIVITGARLAGAAFVTTFGATLGAHVGNAIWAGMTSVWGEEEQACR